MRTIVGVATSITAFLGTAEKGPTDEAVRIVSFSDFVQRFGDLNVAYPMAYAVRDFYQNGGEQAVIVRLYQANGQSTGEAQGGEGVALDDAAYIGDRDTGTGKFLLENVDLFNLMCLLPSIRGGTVTVPVYQDALTYCRERRAFLVVDPPADATPPWTHDNVVSNTTELLLNLGLSGVEARNAALFYPRVRQTDPRRGGQVDTFPGCGAIAGTMARTDAQRGVWKAAAGIEAGLEGLSGLADELTGQENGVLSRLGINCIRTFPVYGFVVWGARTLRGADEAADEYKYIPVRRTALFLEESLYRGLKWVEFEPNDEPLWAQIRLDVGAFLQTLFRQGAFQGPTPPEAYFVKCDKETTTQNDIDRGIVNIIVGFAPLSPGEFVILKVQQMAGQIDG